MYSTDQLMIAGYGAVLVGDVGAKAPTIAEVEQWIADGAENALAGHEPLGFTSLDSLPTLESETEGGETKGAWEKRDIRKTATTQTDSIVINAIQWSEEVMSARFGTGTIDPETGAFLVPDIYEATERSMLVILREGASFIMFHWPRVSSAPEGSIELSSEDFAALPIRYTVLQAIGSYKFRPYSNMWASTHVGGDE